MHTCTCDGWKQEERQYRERDARMSEGGGGGERRGEGMGEGDVGRESRGGGGQGMATIGWLEIE